MARGPQSIFGARPAICAALAGLLLSTAGAGQSFAQVPDLSERIAQQQRERIEELNREAAARQTGDPVVSDPAVRRELPPKGGPTVKLSSVTFEPASAFLTEDETGCHPRQVSWQAGRFRRDLGAGTGC